MAGYEYGNARLRAMRSRLLTPDELNQMAGAGSLSELTAMMTKTPYRRAVELSLIHTGELEALYAALRRDFIETAEKIRRFYDGAERQMVDLVLSGYDLHNIKTVLRGLARAAPRGEIENALLPVGELSERVLGELLRAASPRQAIDVLATIGHHYAQPLLALRAEKPGANLYQMELALDDWRYRHAERFLKSDPDGARRVQRALRIEADIANILTVLRFVGSPDEQRFLKKRPDSGAPEGMYSPYGSITTEQLNRMFQAGSLKTAVDVLAGSPYEAALNEGLRAFEQTGKLSAVEKALRRYQLCWLAGQIAQDPLGIGVALGYMALKNNETANLRRIARGVQLRLGAENIRALLEFAQ